MMLVSMVYLIIIGLMAKHVGRNESILTCGLGCSIGCIIVAIAPNYPILLFGYLLFGFWNSLYTFLIVYIMESGNDNFIATWLGIVLAGWSFGECIMIPLAYIIY